MEIGPRKLFLNSMIEEYKQNLTIIQRLPDVWLINRWGVPQEIATVLERLYNALREVVTEFRERFREENQGLSYASTEKQPENL